MQELYHKISKNKKINSKVSLIYYIVCLLLVHLWYNFQTGGSNMVIRLKAKVLENNTILSEDEKNLIRWIVSIASYHENANDIEITAYKFLHSLAGGGTVCLADVVEHIEIAKICSLFAIHSKGVSISDFWYFVPDPEE